MCCYLILYTAGSEQNLTVLLSNTEYKLDFLELYLVTVQLQYKPLLKMTEYSLC